MKREISSERLKKRLGAPMPKRKSPLLFPETIDPTKPYDIWVDSAKRYIRFDNIRPIIERLRAAGYGVMSDGTDQASGVFFILMDCDAATFWRIVANADAPLPQQSDAGRGEPS